MIPFLVRARIPDLGPAPEGAIVLYLAMFSTEQEAIDAVKSAVPSHWHVDEVVGKATDRLVERLRTAPGTVQQL